MIENSLKKALRKEMMHRLKRERDKVSQILQSSETPDLSSPMYS